MGDKRRRRSHSLGQEIAQPTEGIDVWEASQKGLCLVLCKVTQRKRRSAFRLAYYNGSLANKDRISAHGFGFLSGLP